MGWKVGNSWSVFSFQFSVFNFQFSVSGFQFAVFNFQFAVFNLQFLVGKSHILCGSRNVFAFAIAFGGAFILSCGGVGVGRWYKERHS